MAFSIRPRDNEFFNYFNESSQAVCDGARILKDFVIDQGDPDQELERLNVVEARGEQVFIAIVDRLNDSFITPFEREDIFHLARELNGILDYIHGIMEMMVLYKASNTKYEQIKTLVEVLEKAAVEIKNAVWDLKSLKRNYDKVLVSCDQIKEYEHEGDFLYRTGIALLFEKVNDVIEIIKWKEIFEHLETALDRCEDVSNVLKGVAVKYV